ncbi:MAG TPA: HNH endonuclease [Blastocatellia bacterium]
MWKHASARAAGNRCGYCLARQEHVLQVLEIEHIVPTVRGGSNSDDNLWLACRLCNNAKGVKAESRDPTNNRRVRLFNPRTQRWDRHFRWSEDGTRIMGRTACGRATIEALKLNNGIALVVRQNWVNAGWHPQKRH